MRPGQNSFEPPAWLRVVPDGVVLSVKLQPRASTNAIIGTVGGELKIKVTAPPVDSAANERLVQLLAEVLNIAPGCVELIRGHTSRHKVVKLHRISASEVTRKLMPV